MGREPFQVVVEFKLVEFQLVEPCVVFQPCVLFAHLNEDTIPAKSNAQSEGGRLILNDKHAQD